MLEKKYEIVKNSNGRGLEWEEKKVVHPPNLFERNMIKMWVHVLWTTNRQYPVIYPELRKKLFPYMIEYCALNEIKIDCLNGYAEHVHILFPYQFDMDLEKNVLCIQKASELWINKHGLIKEEDDEKFCWNHNFITVTVGQSSVDALRTNIKAQEVIHKRKTFKEEFEEIGVRYGFGGRINYY